MKIDVYLEKAMLNLLETKPIDRIYVVEIIREVGTCKGTFYKYFRDKYDLICRCFDHYIYGDILQTSETWEEMILSLLGVFRQHAQVILHSFMSEDANSVRHYHEQILSGFLTHERAERGLKTEGKVYEYALRMYAAHVTGLTVSWLEEGCTTKAEELVELMRATMPVALCEDREDVAARQSR